MLKPTLIQSTKGFIRLSKARSAGLSYRVQRQAKAGQLVKVRPGLYRLSRLEDHPQQDLIDVCTAFPRGVICLVSALAYHGLTTTLPKEVWVAIPRNAYVPVMGLPCRFIRMGEGIHRAGVEAVQMERRGTLRIFGKAVSVCQALHFRERIGLDLALEALRTYLREGGHPRAGGLGLGLPRTENLVHISGSHSPMIRKPDPASPESVLAWVRNQARPGVTPHNAHVIFILERFLARIARSAHRDYWVPSIRVFRTKAPAISFGAPGPWPGPDGGFRFLPRSIRFLARALAVHPKERGLGGG